MRLLLQPGGRQRAALLEVATATRAVAETRAVPPLLCRTGTLEGRDGTRRIVR